MFIFFAEEIKPMKTCLLTFDLEEFVAPKERGVGIPERRLFEVSIEGLKNLVQLLNKNNIKATFFTTKYFAENKFVKKILIDLVKQSYEIALHGNDHIEVYSEMSDKSLLKSLSEAKKYLEDTFQVKISGFRAPRLQKVSFDMLKKLNISYEASLHPTWVPRHYNNFFKSREIKSIDGLKIIPISVTPLLRLPFSWFWFRNLGLNYVKLCTLLNFLNSNFVHLYFHPWDFYDFSKDKTNYCVNKLFIMNTDKSLQILDKYILWLKSKNVVFKTVGEYLNEH